MMQATACGSDISFSIGLDNDFEVVTMKEHAQCCNNYFDVDVFPGIIDNTAEKGFSLFPS